MTLQHRRANPAQILHLSVIGSKVKNVFTLRLKVRILQKAGAVRTEGGVTGSEPPDEDPACLLQLTQSFSRQRSEM